MKNKGAVAVGYSATALPVLSYGIFI